MDEQRPVGRKYEGHSGIARDSVWLTHEDLEVRGKTEATLEIAEVQIFDKVAFEGGRTKLNFLGLRFKGAQRILGLNATNRKALNELFGKDTRKWPGQSITLFVTQTRGEGGKQVDCLRIKKGTARAVSSANDFLGTKPATKSAGTAPPAADPAPAADQQLALEPQPLPATWSEGERSQFNEACSAMDLTQAERDAALKVAGADFGRAMVEVDNAESRRS